jgi:hypothetical protein
MLRKIVRTLLVIGVVVPFVGSLKQGYFLPLKGSTHSTYISDEALLGPVVPGLKDDLETIDGKRAVTIINIYVSSSSTNI